MPGASADAKRLIDYSICAAPDNGKVVLRASVDAPLHDQGLAAVKNQLAGVAAAGLGKANAARNDGRTSRRDLDDVFSAFIIVGIGNRKVQIAAYVVLQGPYSLFSTRTEQAAVLVS